MPLIELLPENEPPQPVVLDDGLARATTRDLVGKLEAVALGAQAVNLVVAAYIDATLAAGAHSLLLGFAAIHAIAAAFALRLGGPFLRGGGLVVGWIGVALLMPLLIGSMTAAGDYGSNPSCVQLCSYPAPPLILFAFYPWLSPRSSYLRPAADIVLLAAVVLGPVFVIWHINGFMTFTNAWSVANAAIVNTLAYGLGRALGKMCRTAAEGQLKALRREYHRMFHYLHGQTENALAAISWYYTSGRSDLVLLCLTELSEVVNQERISLILTDDTISLSTVLNLHARAIPPGTMVVRLPRAGGVTLRRSAGVLVSAALGDLLKNVVRHSHATTVTIGFTIEQNIARVSVTDDGIGFDPSAITDGTSLASLHRLLAASGGGLRIDSRPGHGTAAVSVVPLVAP